MQTSVATQAEAQSTAPTPPKPPPTIKALLVKLIFACWLPGLLGGFVMIYIEYDRGLAIQQESALQRVAEKLDAVDAELAQTELVAQALSITGSINQQNFASFHQQSVSLLRHSDLNFSVILYDAGGQQLLNTDVPYGSPLPKRQDIRQIQSVFATGRSVKSRNVRSSAKVGFLVPVFSGQKVAYALAVDLAPKHLNTVLKLNELPPNIIAVIINDEGNIAATSGEMWNFIGQKAHPEMLKQIVNTSEGTFDLTSFTGIPQQARYLTSPISGWTVIIASPHHYFGSKLTNDLIALALWGSLLLSLSLFLAWLAASRISKAVSSLNTTVLAFGSNIAVGTTSPALAETNELSQALQKSSRLLQQRTQQLISTNDALQERSTELIEAQHIAKTGNWKWDASTGTLFASEELLRMYGPNILLPFSEQRGTVFPDKTWQELKSAAKAAVQSKTGFTLLLPTFSEVGTPIWARVNGDLVCNSLGDVTGLRGTLQDVDLFVKAEIDLKNSEARLSLALANSDLAFWDWNIATDALYFDARWASIPGYIVSEMPSNKEGYMQLIHTEDVANVQASIQRHFEGKTTNFEVTYRLHHKSGHYVWMYGNGRVVERDAGGNPVRMLGVAYDISERKHNETVMKALQDELDATLVWQVAQHTVAALAHEVNQPLASASILCEAAKRMLVSDGLSDDARTENSKRIQQTLQSISSEIERAGGVLRNLFKSLHKPDIKKELLDVKKFVDDATQIAIEEGVFGYQIITDYAVDFRPVMVNRLKVVKVLLNLIHNAAQAMHGAKMANGRIWICITMSANGSEICVSVRDEGPGISAELEQEIFQPFITTKSHGLGMGLTISRALIEANNGKLWHTQNDGLGATFHFTLPILS
jgi:PAS domain S-box-containing protein